MNQSVESLQDGVYNTSGSPATAMCSKVVLNDGHVARLNSNTVDLLYIPTIVYVSVLLCVGIPGNALVAYVYTSWRRSPSRLVIIALAVFDLVNCLFTIPTEIYFILNIYLDPNPILCKVTRFFTFSMNNASSFVLLFIAVDRFKRIYKPLKPPFSNRITKTMIGISFAVAFIFSWPSLLIYGRQTFNIPLSNDTCIRVRTCLIDDDVKTSIYRCCSI